MSIRSWVKDVASSLFFDNDGTEFTADNVQDALVEIGASASPGFSWGSSGNVNNNTWLENDGVVSNRAGRTLFLSSPRITQIFTATENLNTYNIGIYEHEGDEINLTLLTTVVITASRAESFTVDVSATTGRQLAVRVTSGSAKNLVVGVIVKGSV